MRAGSRLGSIVTAKARSRRRGGFGCAARATATRSASVRRSLALKGSRPTSAWLWLWPGAGHGWEAVHGGEQGGDDEAGQCVAARGEDGGNGRNGDEEAEGEAARLLLTAGVAGPREAAAPPAARPAQAGGAPCGTPTAPGSPRHHTHPADGSAMTCRALLLLGRCRGGGRGGGGVADATRRVRQVQPLVSPPPDSGAADEILQSAPRAYTHARLCQPPAFAPAELPYRAAPPLPGFRPLRPLRPQARFYASSTKAFATTIDRSARMYRNRKDRLHTGGVGKPLAQAPSFISRRRWGQIS